MTFDANRLYLLDPVGLMIYKIYSQLYTTIGFLSTTVKLASDKKNKQMIV